MGIKIRGKKFKEITPDIEKALDKGFARFMLNYQGELVKGTPVDTGRLASSWFIGKDNPDRSYRPKDWTGGVVQQGFTGRITYGKTGAVWYISNNLPYAERLCFDMKWAKTPWFTNITSQGNRVLGETMQKALNSIPDK